MGHTVLVRERTENQTARSTFVDHVLGAIVLHRSGDVRCTILCPSPAAFWFAMLNHIILDHEFAQLTCYWAPRVVAELNGQYVKVAKVYGEFVWHTHDEQDELFLVHRGELRIRLRGDEVRLQAGALYVVPRGIEHCPYAPQETQIVLFEPMATAHTGAVESALTVSIERQRPR